MLESSFLSPSWDPEIYPDWTLQDMKFENGDYYWNNQDRLTISHCDFNSNSSDIDGFNLEDFDNNLPLSDAFVSQILGENNIANNDIDSSSVDDCYSEINSLSTQSSKKKHSRDISSKTWSNMSREDKEKSLLFISEITCQMGIREQLKVIRIMDPNVVISADMKEFTLDVSLLDDIRWKKIKDYFRRHQIALPSPNTSTNKYLKHENSSQLSKAKKSSCVSRTSRKHRQKKQKLMSEVDENSKLRRKQLRQGIKEEKSGLFVYEKVIKFSNLEEDEDVNILE